jgi:hypothetical protein
VKHPFTIIGTLVAVAALVAAVPRLFDGETKPHAPRRGHPETLAAAVALTYARAVQVGDSRLACGTMTSEAAAASGCATSRPRVRPCGDFDIPSTEVLRFEDSSRATIHVGACRIELVPGRRTGWAVTEVVRDRTGVDASAEPGRG